MNFRKLVPSACTLSLAIVSLSAQTFTELKQFSEGSVEGLPWSTMVEVQPGLFYGTTGGSSSNLGAGGGTLFSITSSGAFTHLHQFAAATADRPIGQLIQASDGMLYGTTFGVGIETPAAPQAGYASSLFRSDLTGNVTTLIDFTQLSAGAVATPPTAGADGALYGGVGFFNFPSAFGFIYRYTLDGTFKVLHVFPSLPGYLNPLIQGSDGNLYGAVQLGNTNANFHTEIFSLSPSGTYTPILTRRFSGGTLLAQGLDDKLYGVDGITSNYSGEVFSLNFDGSDYKVLQSFGSSTTCLNEYTGFTLASDGNLYAGCTSGFANGNGGVFRITPGGAYQQVHSFTSGEGTQPSSLSGLAVQGTDGVLYGELYSGLVASNANGAIYAFDVNLPKPLPRTRVLTPSVGSTGSTVLIFGTGFLGATAVSFNGIAAPFTVPSGIYIQATVPAGATTGPITITTPNGTATSQALFTIQ